MSTEKKIESKEIYKGRIITLELDKVELPDGTLTSREVIRHCGGVCVLAQIDGDILFVKQYRYPYATELLELPAGKLEPKEDPVECGLRELREETGYKAEKLHSLGKAYPTPGYVDEVLHLYYAENLTFAGQDLDPGEFLTVHRIPLDKAVEMCINGEIADAKTQIAVLKFSAMQGR